MLLLAGGCAEMPTATKRALEKEAPIRPRSRALAGGGSTCAIEGGELFCWGHPVDSPGPGAPPWRTGAFTASAPHFPPYRVLLPRPVLQVSTGSMFGCALLVGGAVHCFGLMRRGPACEEAATHLFVPVPLPEPAVEIAVKLAVGDATACARFESGGLGCWGGSRESPRDRSVSCALRRVETSDGQPLGEVARFEVGAAIDTQGIGYVWDHLAPRLVARAVDVPASRDVAALGPETFFVARDGELWLHVDGETRPFDAPPVERVRCGSECFAITATADERQPCGSCPPLRSGGRGRIRPAETELLRLRRRAERLFPETRFEDVRAFDSNCLRDAHAVHCWRPHAPPAGADILEVLGPWELRLEQITLPGE